MKNAPLYTLILSCVVCSSADGQIFDERFDDWPLKTSVNGKVAVGRSLDDPELLRSLLPRNIDGIRIAIHGLSNSATSTEDTFELLKNCDVRTYTADDGNIVGWTKSQLHDVDVFCWFSDGRANSRLPTELKAKLTEFVQTGKSLIVTGPNCINVGAMYQDVNKSQSVWRSGMGLIPDAVIRWKDPSNGSRSLAGYLRTKPGKFGVTLKDDTVLVLSGRRFRVVGPGSAEFILPKCDWLPERQQLLAAQKERQQNPNEYLVDLTEWRREAIERTLPRFPFEKPAVPHVENGTLVIVGGGGMPEGLMQQFVDFAGGAEKARLIYVPCTEQAQVSPRQGIVEVWKKMGVKHATFIHTKDREKANTDEQFMAPLKDATGIWFGGGRQWNFADSYYGTKTHELMKAVLRRGGLIGGSSAGASVQARYLARATPIQNFRIMAPGYERGGLGFISGVAIDQHFTQRGRQKDMTQLVNRYPQMLGIGIDEGTALIVKKSEAEVVGQGDVYFYDRHQHQKEAEPDYFSLGAGGAYDLAMRKVVKEAAVKPAPSEDSETP